jgi:rhamnosyltransferase
MFDQTLSIIILTKNGGKLFSDVLGRLFACDGLHKAEVIVIDSGSTDATLEYARRYSQIKIIQISPSEFGHGKTRNLGAQIAAGDILVYLVQDATPVNPNFLTSLVSPFADPLVAATYGRQIPRDSANPVERFFLGKTYPGFRQVRAHDGADPAKIRSLFFSNVCSAIRRSVWKQIPFDENLIMSEDQQWAKQVLQANYHIIYEQDAVVYHSHNYGLRQIFQRNFDSGFSMKHIVSDSYKEMAIYEIKHIWAGIKQLTLWKKAHWIPYFFLQDGAKSLGFFMGWNACILPASVKKSLSLHKYYWKQRL